MNACARIGRSRGRSRSGGIVRVMPFSRKNRSRRKASRETSASRSRFVAAMKRTSTLRGRTPPTRNTSRVSMTRRSIACSLCGSSPISSRNTVPPGAISIKPVFACAAPVNAPRSWPNSSVARSERATAAQSIGTNGRDARADAA